MTRRSLLSSVTTGGPQRLRFLRKESVMNRAIGERRRDKENDDDDDDEVDGGD